MADLYLARANDVSRIALFSLLEDNGIRREAGFL